MTAKEQLRDIFMFKGLPEEVYDSVYRTLVKNSKERILPKGELLYSPGDYTDHIIALLQGTVKSLWYSETGEELASTFFDDQGTRVLLCIPCISHVPLRSYYMAKQRSRLLYIPRDDFLAAMDMHPQFKNNVMMHLCNVSESRLNHLYIIQHKKAVHRICSYLIEKCQDSGSQTVEGFGSFGTLANYLNLTRPAFSRELHTLERQGILKVSRGSITVSSMEGLHDIMRGRAGV